jgi:hypothetical protein
MVCSGEWAVDTHPMVCNQTNRVQRLTLSQDATSSCQGDSGLKAIADTVSLGECILATLWPWLVENEGA